MNKRLALTLWGAALLVMATAGAAGANLLLNTGPLPDGSLDPVDMETLKRVGDRLRSEGFPTEVTP